MSYPKYSGKFNEIALFSAKDFMNTVKIRAEHKIPEKIIICYYPGLLDYFRKKYSPDKMKITRNIEIESCGSFGMIYMTGIGAPHAVAIVEDLIALGCREFLNIGSAGGLKNFGIFLCEKALRDEGTSYHYLPDGDYVFPDQELTKKLEAILIKEGMEFELGTTWTTDAPYRETISEVKFFKEQGVATVDMEASALFALGEYRKVKVAAAFAVSDLLGEAKWDPQFNAKKVKTNLNSLVDLAVACFKD